MGNHEATLTEKARAILDKMKEARYQAAMIRAAAATAAQLIVAGKPPHIVYVTDAFLKLFGYTREQLIDQPLNILIPARFHGAHDAHAESYIAHPERREMGALSQQLYGLKADGTEIPVIVGLDGEDILDEPCGIATIRAQKK